MDIEDTKILICQCSKEAKIISIRRIVNRIFFIFRLVIHSTHLFPLARLAYLNFKLLRHNLCLFDYKIRYCSPGCYKKGLAVCKSQDSQQHCFWIFHEFFEMLKPLSADSTINYTMIARQSYSHDISDSRNATSSSHNLLFSASNC